MSATAFKQKLILYAHLQVLTNNTNYCFYFIIIILKRGHYKVLFAFRKFVFTQKRFARLRACNIAVPNCYTL